MVDSAGASQRDDARAASRADGQTRIWSTDGVPLRERFSYWREVVCGNTGGFFGTPTQAPPGVFSARLAIRSCGPLGFVMAESETSYPIVLTRRDIANAPCDHYALYLQLSGEAIAVVGD